MGTPGVRRVGLALLLLMAFRPPVAAAQAATVTLTIELAGTSNGTVAVSPGAELCRKPASTSCAVPIATGTAVTLVANAPVFQTPPGVFSSGTGSAAACGKSSCTFTITADSTVRATFDSTLGPFVTITAGFAGDGQGEVGIGNSKRQNYDPVSPGTATRYASGSVVSIGAVPASESRFSTFSAGTNGAAACGASASCTFTADADASVIANFHALTALAVAPLTAAVAVGRDQQFSAVGTYSNGVTEPIGTAGLGTWRTKAPMTTARATLGAAAVNGMIYAIGGAGSTAPGAIVERYDPTSNAWVSRAPMANAREGLGVAVVGNFVYAIGGNAPGSTPVSVVEGYELSIDAWTLRTPMTAPRRFLAAAAVNGIVYAIGGETAAGTAVTTVEAYDPVADAWSARAPMKTARRYLAAVALNGLIYALGGDAGSTVGTVEAYDPATNTWTPKAAMPGSHGAVAAAVVDGVIYVFAGDNAGGKVTAIAYDAARDQWTLKNEVPTPRAEFAAAALGGIVYVIGGRPPTGALFKTVEAFTDTVRWSSSSLSVATVNQAGRALAITPGQADIVATIGSFTCATGGACGKVSASCSYAIAPASATVGGPGGAGAVAVTAGAGCAWTAVSNSSFVAVTAGASGSGDGTVTYSVAAASSGGAQRTGTVTIAGSTFTVSQDPACSYALDRTSAAVSRAGGPLTVSLTTQPACAWTASTTSGFVSILPGSNGLGSGPLSLSVLANNSPSSRSAEVSIAGITFTVVQDPGCGYALDRSGAAVPAAGGALSVSVTTQAGCGWTVSTASAFVTIMSGSNVTGSGTVSLSVLPNQLGTSRSLDVTIAGLTFTIVQSGLPTMTFDRTALTFAATTTGAAFTSQTGSQALRLTQTGQGAVTWTAASSVSWLVVTPASGSGSATVNVSVRFLGGLAASQTGRITVAYTGAGNAASTIDVTLTTSAVSAAPQGAFDTPLDGSTGVTGSIAVTGWAIDDVEVTRVRIFRDPAAGEPAGSLVFLGDAVLVDGARPDVQAGFPNAPRNTRAGWGYLLLTNFLPGLGNGTFKLYAIADDTDGHSTTLGSKTIICTNSTATAPFGAIDTPAQGETVSGTINNFGWVLSPGLRRSDPPSGGTVRVVIDGVIGAAPDGWVSRPDLSSLFPLAQFSGIDRALGVAPIDTTTLTNGVHTISWLVTDSLGTASGVGSRYFTVSNGSGLTMAPDSFRLKAEATGLEERPLAAGVPGAIAWLPPSGGSIRGRRGFDLETPYRSFVPDSDGRILVRSEELDRIELQLDPAPGETYQGYLRVGDGFRPLPAGSTLDAATGVFTWSPGVGFVGPYDFVFVRSAGGAAFLRHDVRIVLLPKSSR